MAALAERERIPFIAALGQAADAPGIASRSVAAIGGFTALLERLGRLREDGSGIGDILEAILEQSGYLAELRASRDPQDETRLENLHELVSVAREFDESRVETGEVISLDDFLERVSLVADADEIPDDVEGRGVVTLMTLHTAKGLEFPVVFLTGMEDGTFPHQRSLGDPAELEEERRLAYVGITRARERLHISRASVRSAWAARPGVRSPGNKPILALAQGDRVSHDSFGLGTVIRVEGAQEKSMAHVDFGGDAGVKRLLLRYAPLVKL